MPLAITADHRELADVAKAMVAGRGGLPTGRRILLDPDVVDRWWLSDPLWKEIVSTGWLGLHVDEQTQRFRRQESSDRRRNHRAEQQVAARIDDPRQPSTDDASAGHTTFGAGEKGADASQFDASGVAIAIS